MTDRAPAPDGTGITVRCGRCRLTKVVIPGGVHTTVGEAIEEAVADNHWSLMQWTDKKFLGLNPATVTQHRLICEGCHGDLVKWARNEDVVSRETGA